MIIEIVRCDRCGDAITGNGPMFRFTGSYFQFDLCGPCNHDLEEWLAVKRDADEVRSI